MTDFRISLLKDFCTSQQADEPIRPKRQKHVLVKFDGLSRKLFSELSSPQKRRRVEEYLTHSTESLAYATSLSSDNKNVAAIIK